MLAIDLTRWWECVTCKTDLERGDPIRSRDGVGPLCRRCYRQMDIDQKKGLKRDT